MGAGGDCRVVIYICSPDPPRQKHQPRPNRRRLRLRHHQLHHGQQPQPPPLTTKLQLCNNPHTCQKRNTFHIER